MGLYGYFAFLAGLGIAWAMWRPNDPVPGGLIYRAYWDYSGKLDLLLELLDEDWIFDDYQEKNHEKITYFAYCRAVEAYRPVAREQLRKFYKPYFIHLLLKPNLPLIIIVVPIFILAIHWLLLGILVYCVLRYLYHHFTIVIRQEPVTLVNILSANAIKYSRTNKNPETER